MNAGQSNGSLTAEELERVLAAVGEVRREMALAEDEQQRRTERPAKRPAQHQISGQAVLAYIGGVVYYLIGSFFGGFFGSLIAQAFLFRPTAGERQMLASTLPSSPSKPFTTACAPSLPTLSRCASPTRTPAAASSTSARLAPTSN